MTNLYTTIIAQLYAVFIPSELQRCDIQTRTLLTYYKPVSHEGSPSVCTSRNTKKIAYPRTAYIPKGTDDYLDDHGLPIIAFCHQLRISYFITITAIKIIFMCGLLPQYLWE